MNALHLLLMPEINNAARRLKKVAGANFLTLLSRYAPSEKLPTNGQTIESDNWGENYAWMFYLFLHLDRAFILCGETFSLEVFKQLSRQFCVFNFLFVGTFASVIRALRFRKVSAGGINAKCTIKYSFLNFFPKISVSTIKHCRVCRFQLGEETSMLTRFLLATSQVNCIADAFAVQTLKKRHANKH